MSKQEAMVRLDACERSKLAIDNLQALECIFWGDVRIGVDRANLVGYILAEAFERGEKPYQKALSLLAELPSKATSYFATTEFLSTKTALWEVILDNWLECRTPGGGSRDKDVELGSYILSVTERAHGVPHCREFEKMLRQKLELNCDWEIEQYVPRIRRLLRYAAVHWDGDNPFRPELIRLLAHAYDRYSVIEDVLRKFKHS